MTIEDIFPLAIAALIFAIGFISEQVAKLKKAKLLREIESADWTKDTVILKNGRYVLKSHVETAFKCYSYRDIEFLCELAKDSFTNKSLVYICPEYRVNVFAFFNDYTKHQDIKVECEFIK